MHPYARSMMKVSAIQSALQTLYPGVGIAGEYSPKEYGNHQFSILQGGPVIEELGLGWSSLTNLLLSFLPPPPPATIRRLRTRFCRHCNSCGIPFDIATYSFAQLLTYLCSVCIMARAYRKSIGHKQYLQSHMTQLKH